MIRDAIEVVIAWAEQMSKGAGGFLNEYRVVVNLNVKSGPMTAAEQKQNNANVEAGTLSVETAMARNRVEDVDAELEKIRNSPESVVSLRSKQIEIITALRGEQGMTWERAATIAGLDTEDELMELFKEADAEEDTSRSQESTFEDEVDALLAGTGAQG